MPDANAAQLGGQPLPASSGSANEPDVEEAAPQIQSEAVKSTERPPNGFGEQAEFGSEHGVDRALLATANKRSLWASSDRATPLNRQSRWELPKGPTDGIC